MRTSIVMTDPRKADRMYQEAIKNLRTNLSFVGMNIKCIAITSCFPNEGKSDVSFQLARELGNIDKRVVLLDADIRKSAYVSRYSVGTQVKGLSHYLSGQAELDEVVCNTNYPNMDIVFAGSMAPNPSELLESEAMRDMIARLREEYDYILIDTPPVATMSDAMIVAKWCDGTVLIIESAKVSYRIAQKAKQQLMSTGCRLLGAVLNKVDTSGSSYYNKYGYYKRYGYYRRYGYYGRYGYGGYYGYGSERETAVDVQDSDKK